MLRSMNNGTGKCKYFLHIKVQNVTSKHRAAI